MPRLATVVKSDSLRWRPSAHLLLSLSRKQCEKAAVAIQTHDGRFSPLPLLFQHRCFSFSPSLAFSIEGEPMSKHWPRNAKSSFVEWNRRSVQESTSSTQPSNKPSTGRQSFPSRITNARLISLIMKELLDGIPVALATPPYFFLGD